MAELQGLQGDSGPATPSRHPIRQEDEDGVGHSLMQTIKDRIALYREAEQVATAQGEGAGLLGDRMLDRACIAGEARVAKEKPPLLQA